MPTTHKTILVKDKSINEIMDISKTYLQSNGFKTKELQKELIGTRGLGIVTSQQRFVLRFSQGDSNTVYVDGEFFTITLYFIENTVAEKALMLAIPRRTGYRLMMQYISRIDGEVS